MERCLHVFDLCSVKVFDVRSLRSDHQFMHTAANSTVSLQRYSCLHHRTTGDSGRHRATPRSCAPSKYFKMVKYKICSNR